jgi:hypothetical protein
MYNPKLKPLPAVTLIVPDVIEMIAYQLLNPEIVCANRREISIEYKPQWDDEADHDENDPSNRGSPLFIACSCNIIASLLCF